MVVRSCGEVTGSKVYRGKSVTGAFLTDIMQEEEKKIIITKANKDDA